MMSENTMDEGRDNYDLDDLLGAYALDAIDPDEAVRVEDYLAVNPKAAAEVREHREVATMLAFTGMDAPEGLWSRIESELDAPTPVPGPELAKIMSIDSAPSKRRLASLAPWLASAAAAAVIAVVAIAMTDRAAIPTDPLVAAFQEAQSDRDSAQATLVAEGSDAQVTAVIDQDGHGYIDAAALPQLPDDKTYQLWGVIDDRAISLGIFGPNPELETFTSESQVAVLAITIEDAPGVISDGNQDGWYVGALT